MPEKIDLSAGTDYRVRVVAGDSVSASLDKKYYEGVETQRDLLVKYCKSHGYTNIVDIIMDDDKSGTDINLRLERGDKGAYIELLENESGK